MDITVEVMLPPRGGSDWGVSANAKWRVLTPVAIYTLRQPAVVGMPNTGYIHVTGIPKPVAWDNWTDEQIISRLNSKLCSLHLDNDRNMIERRAWAADHLVIPAAARNALLTNRQITVTWLQFKAALKHRVSGLELTLADIA
jgi:hypothetical protein